jgi:iron complex outermembrane receptor protein
MGICRTLTEGFTWPLLAVIALAIATPAIAQDNEDDDLGGIDAIVVTITKRDESIQEVAGTIAAFDSDTIEAADIQDIGDLISLLPNVTSKGPGTDLGIRGVTRSNIDGQSPVAQHVNGIYRATSLAYTGQFYDLESIQVALGPAGSLYGRNATGGAIDIRWKKPHDEYEVFGDTTYAYKYSNWQFRGGVNIPLLGEGNDTAMLRLVAIRETQDGLTDNLLTTKRKGFGAKDDLSLRGTLLLNLTEDLSIELRVHRVSNKYDWAGGPLSDPSSVPVGSLPFLPGQPALPLDWASGMDQFGSALSVGIGGPPIPSIGHAIATCGFTFQPGPACGFLPAPLIRSPEFLTPAQQISQDEQETRSNIQALGDGYLKIWGYDTTIEYAMNDVPVLGDLSFTLAGGYQRIRNQGLSDSDGTELAALDTASGQLPQEDYTFEARLASNNESWFNWTLGFFYLHNSVVQFRNTLTPVTESGGRTWTTQEGYAPFVNVTLTVPEALTKNAEWLEGFQFFAGFRYNNDQFDQFVVNNPTPFDLNPVPVALSDVFRERTMDFEIKYFLTDDAMIYAKWSRGYKAGFAINLPAANTASVVAPVKPEKIKATEIGAKTAWFEGRLTANVSAFRYQYTDFQVPLILITGIPHLNAEKATIMGAELELLYRPTEEWTTRLALGWLDAEFKKFCSLDPLLDLANPNIDPACEGQFLNGPGTDPLARDLSGKTPEDSPKWKASLLSSYEIDLGEMGTVTPTLELTWTARSFRRPFNNNNEDLIDDYTKTDLRVRWDNAEKSVFAEVFVENLEDKIIYGRVIIVGLTGTATNFGLFQPRTVGVRFGFNWGGNK